MKLKKIVSALIAFSMVSAMGISSVSAENYANPIIHVDSEVFTDTSAQYYKAVAGYTTYLVSYSIEGIDNVNSQTNFICVDYDVTGDYDAKSFEKSKKSGATNQRDLKGVYSAVGGEPTTLYPTQFTFLNADGLWDHIDYDTYPDGSPANVKTLPFMQALIYVKEGSSVAITYNTAIVDGQTSSMIELADGTKYNSNIVYKVNGKVGNTLTLGNAGYDFVEGTKYTVEADGINGVVWAGNEMKNVNSADNDYVATFTADGAEPKTRTLTNLPEATTFTFDAILRFKDNTVKSGLAFDVVEVAK